MRMGEPEIEGDQDGKPALVGEYFSDPLCSWSWAFSFELAKLQDRLPPLKLRMCGMNESWEAFRDPVNSVFRPAQMAPQWLQVSQITAVRLDPNVWLQDPPSSSMPACLLVKAAQLQSEAAAQEVFFALQCSVMTKRINIARENALAVLVQGLKNDGSKVEIEKLWHDFHGQEALLTLQADIARARYYQFGRYPTLMFWCRSSRARKLVLTGYRRAEELLQAVERLEQMDEHL